MTIYIVSFETDSINPLVFDNIVDVDAFEKELTDTYGENWFYDELDALDYLIENRMFL